MTSNPCTIDAEKSVAYAAKMMLQEDVGLAPIVEGDRLIGMLTDREIATRVTAEGRNPITERFATWRRSSASPSVHGRIWTRRCE
jgi:CBS domain-containing protein